MKFCHLSSCSIITIAGPRYCRRRNCRKRDGILVPAERGDGVRLRYRVLFWLLAAAAIFFGILLVGRCQVFAWSNPSLTEREVFLAKYDEILISLVLLLSAFGFVTLETRRN